MNLTDEQKGRIKEAYGRLNPEEQENLKKKFNELSAEELNKVNGGGLLNILANTFGDALETIFDAFVDAHTSHDEVTGPKVNMQTCSICHLPIPSGQIKDHLLNAHKDEIAEFIKNSPIF